MVRVSVKVREGSDLFEVAVHADSISDAVGIARDRFPDHDVRVVFPIDGEWFFGGRGAEGDGSEAGGGLRLLPDRVERT